MWICTQLSARWGHSGGASFTGAILTALLTLLAGCGSAPPEARRAPATAATTPILVTAASADVPGQAVAEALTSRLVKAGYSIVRLPDQPHHVVATIRTNTTEDQNLLTVRVNGQVQKDFTVHAWLEVSGGGRVLNSAGIDFDAAEPVTEATVSPLAAAVGAPPVAAYLAWLRGQQMNQEAEAKRQWDEQQRRMLAEVEAARQRDEQKEQEAWRRLVLLHCAAPTTVDGCDPVEQFIEQYPSSLHVPEAKQVLEEGKPKIARLLDERAWKAAKPEDCRNPSASTDCEGVMGYYQNHPKGAHAAEAKEVLLSAQPAIERLANQERRAGQR